MSIKGKATKIAPDHVAARRVDPVDSAPRVVVRQVLPSEGGRLGRIVDKRQRPCDDVLQLDGKPGVRRGPGRDSGGA